MTVGRVCLLGLTPDKGHGFSLKAGQQTISLLNVGPLMVMSDLTKMEDEQVPFIRLTIKGFQLWHWWAAFPSMISREIKCIRFGWGAQSPTRLTAMSTSGWPPILTGAVGWVRWTKSVAPWPSGTGALGHHLAFESFCAPETHCVFRDAVWSRHLNLLYATFVEQWAHSVAVLMSLPCRLGCHVGLAA